ncbi:MAG: SGNH/GDSL hydrolase family protein [Thermomicrobiales bacterium]
MKQRIVMMLAVILIFPLTVAARPNPPTPPTVPTVPPGIFIPTAPPNRHGPVPTSAIPPGAIPTPRKTATTPGSPVLQPTPRRTPLALFLGDSISDNSLHYGQYADLLCATEGWSRINQTEIYGLPNAAIGGSTLQVIPDNSFVVPYPTVTTFTPRAGIYDVDYLVIFLGTNDYGWSSSEVTPATYRAAWKSLYTQIAAMPSHPHLIVIGLPLIDWNPYMIVNEFPSPLPRPPGNGNTPGFQSWATSITDATARLDAVSQDEAQKHGALWVPLVPGMTEAMFDRPNIHPNLLGMEYIAGQVHMKLH